MKKNIPLIFIPLQDYGYHVFVKAEINGVKNLNLLVDTGASNSVFDIDNSVFDDIDKDFISSETVSSGFNAEIQGTIKYGKIQSLVLNNYKSNVDNAVFTSLNHVNELYSQLEVDNIVGIIGCDYLKNNNAIIDFKNAELLLDKGN